jgi:hypothetical protein
MGAWKRCSKCSGKVEVLTVIRKTGKVVGSTDERREAHRCLNPSCGLLETVEAAPAEPRRTTTISTRRGSR